MSVAFLIAVLFAFAWLYPACDLDGVVVLDARVFWLAVLVGLLASIAMMAARAIWRRSRGW